MNDSSPNDRISPEWLAAYVDGELDGPAAIQVECWLRDHPEALTELFDQQSLSAANEEFVRGTTPPMPSQENWNRVFSGIEQSIAPASAHRTRTEWPRAFLAPALVLAGLAFALLIAVFLVNRDRQPNALRDLARHDAEPRPGVLPNFGDDLEELIFQVATTDDVELIVLPEAAVNLVVVGRHPMADVPLLLASAADLQVLNYGPDEQGNLPDLNTTTGPDASMFWAPSVKP
ncbi:MAG: hypothetical protein K8T89_23055 [Planctomycetes bacterium]|nr:hypothetical protein [Planctomycetota bacterium]